jgi:hypothetical protein
MRNTGKLTSIRRMRIRVNNLIVLALVLFMAAIVPKAGAATVTSSEYQVKAAFLYNFIKFVDWPGEDTPDSNEPIIVGVVGKNPFGDAFVNKQIKAREVVFKQFDRFEELDKSGAKDKDELQKQIEAIRKCHLLFICQSEKTTPKEIIDLVKGHSVLTVGDTKGFLDSGGIIEFVMEEKKVRFEINVAAAKDAKLKIRSQLLRLAKRIVGEKQTGEAGE